MNSLRFFSYVSSTFLYQLEAKKRAIDSSCLARKFSRKLTKKSFSKSLIQICILCTHLPEGFWPLLVIPGTNWYQNRWKWFLPGSRSSLNSPRPREKAKHLCSRTRSFINPVHPFKGPYQGGLFVTVYRVLFLLNLRSNFNTREFNTREIDRFFGHNSLPRRS